MISLMRSCCPSIARSPHPNPWKRIWFAGRDVTSVLVCVKLLITCATMPYTRTHPVTRFHIIISILSPTCYCPRQTCKITHYILTGRMYLHFSPEASRTESMGTSPASSASILVMKKMSKSNIPWLEHHSEVYFL